MVAPCESLRRLTDLATDLPGLIEQLPHIGQSHLGNWLKSRLSPVQPLLLDAGSFLESAATLGEAVVRLLTVCL